jgi:hypothetical protein
MADMEVDPPASPTVKKETKDDGKENKKRFEVKKVRFTSAPYILASPDSMSVLQVECSIPLGLGCVYFD